MEDWDQITAVARMQDYIFAHLQGDITLQELADVSGYSPYYSIRIFRTHTGKTPFEYHRALRLTQAAKELRDSKAKVLEVALEHRYDSHDGFTRAFKRQFGISPKEYHNSTPPLYYFTHYPITQYYCLTQNNKRSRAMMNEKVSAVVTVEAVDRPTRKLIFLRSKNATDYMSYCEEVGCDWEGLLGSISEKMDLPALIELPAKLVTPGTSAIAAGIEVPLDYAKPLPQGYEMVELPACKMLFFTGMPYENEEDFCVAIDIVGDAVEHYDLAARGYIPAFDAVPKFNFGAYAALGAKMAVPCK